MGGRRWVRGLGFERVGNGFFCGIGFLELLLDVLVVLNRLKKISAACCGSAFLAAGLMIVCLGDLRWALVGCGLRRVQAGVPVLLGCVDKVLRADYVTARNHLGVVHEECSHISVRMLLGGVRALRWMQAIA